MDEQNSGFIPKKRDFSDQTAYEQGIDRGSKGFEPVYCPSGSRFGAEGALSSSAVTDTKMDFIGDQRLPNDFLRPLSFRPRNIPVDEIDGLTRERDNLTETNPVGKKMNNIKGGLISDLLADYGADTSPHIRLGRKDSSKYNTGIGDKKVSEEPDFIIKDDGRNHERHFTPIGIKDMTFDWERPHLKDNTRQLRRTAEDDAQNFRIGYKQGLIGSFMPTHNMNPVDWYPALSFKTHQEVAVYSRGLNLKPLRSAKSDSLNDIFADSLEKILESYSSSHPTSEMMELYRLGVVVRIARDYGIVLQKSQVPTDEESMTRLRDGLKYVECPVLKDIIHLKDKYQQESTPKTLNYIVKGDNDKKFFDHKPSATSVDGSYASNKPTLRDEIFPKIQEDVTLKAISAIESYRPQNPDDFFRLGRMIREMGKIDTHNWLNDYLRK
jgi:hypothetical protein